MFFPLLLITLCFLVLGGVSFFLWWRGKSLPAMLMMVGWGVQFLFSFLGMISVYLGFGLWANVFAMILATAGFTLTFWEKIKADVEHFRNLAKQKMAKGGSSPAATTGTPPPPPPPPPPPAG
ncbi:MAG: hypothetical protein MUE73_18105 [Planctomycetes bacterium]|jgi:hypothetical protein|nr:hypothetical protein [Planctomycetota bacterium]